MQGDNIITVKFLPLESGARPESASYICDSTDRVCLFTSLG